MNPATGRKATLETMQAMANDPLRIADALGTVDPPQAIVNWLARLRLLYGVPFQYLVADEGILPVESIRFFRIDPNWIYALIEGAASIARASSSDAAHDAVAVPVLHAAAANAARHLRAPRTGEMGDTASALHSGFLLRSAVVSGWPGLEVRAYDAKDNTLKALRMERLAPSILLFIAEGLIDHIDIHEPPEGMHFGVDIMGGKLMRYVTVPENAPHGTIPGAPITDAPPVPVPMRANRVLAVSALADALRQGLQQQNANNDSSGGARPFTSAEFALEMVEGTQSVRFVNRQQPGTKG
jgi:hypothetical protein